MQCTVTFTAVKIDNFLTKICDIFFIFAQNMDYGSLLEPPHSKQYFRAKIMYNPENPRDI